MVKYFKCILDVKMTLFKDKQREIKLFGATNLKKEPQEAMKQIYVKKNKIFNRNLKKIFFRLQSLLTILKLFLKAAPFSAKILAA